MRLALTLSVLSASLGMPLAAQSQVWTVDDDGPADFASIQSAIDAAQDGDALLIRGGSYAPIAIDAKRLTLLADDGQTVLAPQPLFTNIAGLTVTGLASDQPVTIVGLNLASAGGFGYGIGAGGMQGLLWVQDCTIQGLGGVTATSCTLVVRDSVLQGDKSFASGGFFPVSEGAGISLFDATLPESNE